MKDGGLKKRRIGVLMGGISAEREISLKTGEAILAALKEKGYQAFPLEVDQNLPLRLLEEKIEVAFIALHGRLGEDGTVQGLLELMRIPYTGSGVLASALAMNKLMTKKVLEFHRLPIPRFQVLEEKEIEEAIGEKKIILDFPLVVKPIGEGSTLGVSIVSKEEELLPALQKAAHFDPQILLEEFIQGREITVGILEGVPFPPIEIVPQSGFYDYSSKYTSGATQYILPAQLSPSLYKKVQKLGVEAYQALGCQGPVRVDMILNQKRDCYILEINTIPGMTETSLLPRAAQNIGINFADLVERILKGAGLKILTPPILKKKGL